MSVDPSIVLVEGPWTHTYVAANGARFHVALAGPDDFRAPLVVLLHAFPQLWYAWRAQLPALAEAGYRVAAMDLRGFGASDKPPMGHDTPSLVADVAGVIRSLGASEAVVVGHGYGGGIAWSMPAFAPEVTRAVATLGAPHPVALRRRRLPMRTLATLARLQLPWFPERALRTPGGVTRLLRAWGAPGWEGDATQLYNDAMRLPFVAHTSLELVRWQVRSTPRPDGRRYLAALHDPVTVPVLSLHGTRDRFVAPSASRRDAEFVD